MKLLDRLSDRCVDVESISGAPLHVGRWALTSAPHERVLPGSDGAWALTDDEGEPLASGEGFPGSWPTPPIEDALRTLGESLDELREFEATWSDWAEQCPIPENLSHVVEPDRLEHAILEQLRHLEAVCRDPHTHVELHAERVALGRARKLDRRAPQWLATHSEDWAARKVSGIVPRRLLALVREPRWDLYENRVAARLVDNLTAWLRRRIATLRQIQEEILTKIEPDGELSGTHQRQRRLYAIWGSSWQAGALGSTLRRSLAQATDLLYRVLGLMSSPLYRHVPRSAQVDLHLQRTNLLGNDDDYRGVARLWQAWASTARPPRRSKSERAARALALCHAFEAWCVLLVIRACDQLHLGPVEREASPFIQQGCQVELSGDLSMHWTELGTIRIAEGDRARIEFVPLLQALEGSDGQPTPSRVGPLVETIERTNCGVWRVVLHLGTSPDSAIARVGNPPHPAQAGVIDFIRVSPFALDSVERVARALRWATFVPKMLAYPPRLQAVPDDRRGWSITKEDGSFVLTGPIDDARLRQLDAQIDRASRTAEAKESERNHVVAEARARHGDPRERSELNKRKTILNGEVQKARQRVAMLEQVRASLVEAGSMIEELSRCPVCSAPAAFHARASSCFSATCSRDSCGSTWELRGDESGELLPVLLPASAEGMAWGTNACPDMAERWLGADVLTLPFMDRRGAMRFMKPRRTNSPSLPAASLSSRHR